MSLGTIAALLLQAGIVFMSVLKGYGFLEPADAPYQDIVHRMQEVTSANCHSPDINVYLPSDSVTHVPTWPSKPSDVIPSNRTSLYYAMVTSVSRSIFYTMIYNMTQIETHDWRRFSENYDLYPEQPGFNYISMSTIASVNAGPSGVVASGLMYGINSSYANWIRDNPFNQTVPLIGIRADKVSAGGDVTIKDLGSTPSTDYSDSSNYRQNEFFEKLQNHGYPFATTFTAKIHHDNSGSNYDERTFAVLNFENSGVLPALTRPYFDCGQTNRWLVSYQSLVSERLPRYTPWLHLVSLQAVATSTLDVEFESIDFNPCIQSVFGGEMNRYAGSAVCPLLATGGRRKECKVKHGYGFTDLGFECCDTPQCSVEQRVSHLTYVSGKDEMDRVDSDCATSTSGLLLLGESYYVMSHIERDFEAQGRTAVRLAHFLSDFLQNNNPQDDVEDDAYWQELLRNWNFQEPAPKADSPMRSITSDRHLTWKHIASEAFSALMADGTLMSVGIFFDENVFPNGTDDTVGDPVSAFAWRDDVDTVNDSNQNHFHGNIADLFELGEDYTAQAFFVSAKKRFTLDVETNGHQPPLFASHREARTSRTGLDAHSGSSTVMSESEALQYYAYNFDDGVWTPPYFRCNSRQTSWATSFVIPIVAPSDVSPSGVRFAGVVKVNAFFTDQHISE